MNTKEKADIKENEIKVIDTFEGEKMITKIRVVQWIVNGKKFAPVLEKRQFTRGDNGIRMGKAKGFSLKDLDVITGKWDDVIQAMGGLTTNGHKSTEERLEPVQQEVF